MPTEEESEASRESRNLITIATTTKDDLYALLSLSTLPLSGITSATLKKAWRTTALKWHPDKNCGNEKLAAERYDEARKAFDILCDPAARAAYDDRQRAAREKKERDAAFEGKRRRMKEELERRESAGGGSPGLKRRFEEETVEERKERELRRLAADGARRRLEREEAMRRKREEAVQKAGEEVSSGDVHDPFANNSNTTPAHETLTQPISSNSPTEFSDVDRTIKVRWPRDGAGLDMDKATITRLFSRFGEIESTILLKDKRSRASIGPEMSTSPGDERRGKKQIMATGVIIYNSIVSAHAAVTDTMRIAQKNDDPAWRVLDSVSWASGQAPDLGFKSDSSATPATVNSSTFSSTPQRLFPGLATNGRPATATPSSTTFTPKSRLNVDGLGNGSTPSPSFSFTASKSHNSPTPSLFESTMMRLREAEKRRLEETIKKEDAAMADAQAANC